MKYLSVCSGIEAASVAWRPLGWEAVGFSEIERFPNMVLEHHYPDVPNFGDMNEHKEWPNTNPDVLVGGTPCQSFSVAGLRQGMADPRGNLALVYLAVAERQRPRWLVWENVPGVLSSHGGRDFGSFLGALAELGYGFAYRVLDAQYFGVPQRRRRVFVVGHLGDWRRAAEVLFEPASMRGHPAPSRETGKEATHDIAPRLNTGGRAVDVTPTDEHGNPQIMAPLEAQDGPRWASNQWVDRHKAVICEAPDTANPLTRRMYKGINTTLDEGQTPIVTFNWQNGGGYGKANDGLGIGEDHAGPISRSQVQAVAFSENQRAEVLESDVTRALNQPGGKPGQGYPAIRQHLAVRRLLPVECERLQGFPDGYTDVPGASDTARYKALGNSMAVPVMRWIGERIDKCEKNGESAPHPENA